MTTIRLRRTADTILAIDLGKYKSVACVYRSAEEQRFTTTTTSRAELARLIDKRRPGVILIEACLHAGDGRGRTFSVNLEHHAFHCHDARCGKQGDVIDLWAAVKGLSLRAAALDLVVTFNLEPAPPKGTEKRHG